MLSRRYQLGLAWLLLERLGGPLITVPLALFFAARAFVRWRYRDMVLTWAALFAAWALLDAFVPGWLAAIIVFGPLVYGYYRLYRGYG
jgi:hypothetical protein